MKLQNWFIGFAVFSIVMLVGYGMIEDVNTNYDDINISLDNLNDSYDIINKTYNLGVDMKSETIDADITTEESWESMTKGTFSAVRNVKGTFSFMTSILNEVADVLAIPANIIKLAMTIVVLVVVFSVITIFIRFKP